MANHHLPDSFRNSFCHLRLGGGLTLLTLAALTACGGGGGGGNVVSTVAVSGVVADGPLSGATVCYDLDDNGACDSGEPSSITDTDGKYKFDVDTAVAGKHAVIASVPATAVDKDTGKPVGSAFTLKSPPSGSATAQDVFVSPLTTLVVEVAAAEGSTSAEALAKVQKQLGLAASPLTNFVASGDADAAKLARTVNTVILTVAKLADDAAVPAAQRQALIGSVTTGNLSTLAALVQSSSSSTPVEVAAQVAAAVITERNLTPQTVSQQAQEAVLLTQPPVASPTGPFTSVRRFAFTDANNYFIQAFVGDNKPDADGGFWANETRVNLKGGNALPFNRNTVYWNKTTLAWENCAIAWQVVRTKPQTANTPQDSMFCGASRSLTKIAEVDVAGRKMADVVTEIRARSLRDVPGIDTDVTGLPTRWGPDPAQLGEAVFPSGSKLTPREQTSEVGDTERFSSTDLLRVVPAGGVGTFRHAAALEEAQRMTGDLVDGAAVVTNRNTIFVDDLPFTQTDVTLAQFKRYRAALSPTGNVARFYECNLVLANNSSRDCVALGDGTWAIATQGDARVLRFTSGYPAKLITAVKRQRHYVQYAGGVFGGYKDLERKHFGVRPNTIAWEAIRAALDIAPLPTITAPVTAGPFGTLRSFTYTDAANYSLRAFVGDSSVLDAQGNFLADEERETLSGGVLVDFKRNALYWTGASWFDCGNTGTGVNRISSVAPFTSVYCESYIDDRVSQLTVTLNGSRMSDVVNNIRFYSRKDFTFDYANWGPDPGANPQLASAFFPPGSTMEYRGNQRKATPVAISTAVSSQVRVPPADASVPFNTWPFATSLEEWIAKNPGDLLGGPVNGATAFFVHNQRLASAPTPEFTNEIQWRVAFDANGQKARFYRNNISATTGFTTNYVQLLDTAYTIEMIGGKRVLKFAAMPEGFEASFFFQRMFAEHAGGVWYASKDTVTTDPTYSVRMNRTAAAALLDTLGII